MPTNHDDLSNQPYPPSQPADSESPGYETTDANVGGVAVFLAGLFGFVLIFFGVCFLLGRVINNQITKQDGEPNKWHGGPAAGGQAKRQDLASNPQMEQRVLQRMTTSFPNPRLQLDDGNQDTADLHAREDLFLNHYSVTPETGTVRIPISRAMELITQRGLPVIAGGSGRGTSAGASSAGAAQMAGDVKPEVLSPLTTGFARTGYELDVIEARAQKMSYGKAEAVMNAEPAAKK